MTRTTAQNKALTPVEDKSLTPDYAEPDTEPDTAPEPAADPAPAESKTKAATPKPVEVIWAQFSHGREPGQKVSLTPEKAREMIHAGYAAKA